MMANEKFNIDSKILVIGPRSESDILKLNSYGYKNIEQLISLQQKTFLKNNSFFSINNYSNQIYKILFSNKVVEKYIIIDTLEDFNKIICIKNNYVVKENEYDIFMMDKIIKCLYLKYFLKIINIIQ
jgi:hypothetical protein